MSWIWLALLFSGDAALVKRLKSLERDIQKLQNENITLRRELDEVRQKLICMVR